MASSEQPTAAANKQQLARQSSTRSSAGDDEDEDYEVEYRVKSAAQNIPPTHRLPPAAEEIIAHFDRFGSTPPRTRMKNKYRDSERKQKLECPPKTSTGGGAACPLAGAGAGLTRMLRTRVNRRNTMDCAILNEMFVDDDTSTNRHSDKRSKQLLRDSERDLKRASLAIIGPSASVVVEATNAQMLGDEHAAQTAQTASGGGSRHSESTFAGAAAAGATQSILIKCMNPYKSVSTRPVGCRTSAPATAFPVFSPAMWMSSAAAAAAAASTDEEADAVGLACRFDRSKLQVRREFHETFANLIKLGSDKQDNRASNEIDTWQTELKDLIWLELQAWHAERTPEEQDRYLCAARKDVPKLLEKILNYCFKPAYSRAYSVDSGISSETSETSTLEMPYAADATADSVALASIVTPAENYCKNCISLYCKNCQQQQCVALREVEELLTRLEAAEALYPSSKVMGSYHPVYKSDAFVGRVKAMCLWYNITKYQRLKLTLVGMFFRRLYGAAFQWPLAEYAYDKSKQNFSGTAAASSQEADDSGRDSVDSRKLKAMPPIIPKVKFTVDGDSNTDNSVSPTDSASSVDSDKEAPHYENNISSTFAQFINDVQQFRLDPISRKAAEHLNANGDPAVSPYRRYIEHIMKSRGLGKSLAFLQQLHNVIIRKVQLTLERQGSEDAEFDADIFEDDDDTAVDFNVMPIDQEQEDELRRYGIWSPEAQALDLPSYKPTFVFLSVIPLEILHEYLRMRLESRPTVPNSLSLELLLKEVREGLVLAMTHRERFNKHVHTALEDKPAALDKYMIILGEYDATVSEVMAMYLDYVEQWVLEATPETQQKAALVREWSFTKLLAPMIYGQHSIAATKFCSIVGRLLQNISERLKSRISCLNEQITQQQPVANYDTDKAVVLLLCREMQCVVTVERENAMRVLHFAKALCRDLEQRVFHRDHELCDGEANDAALAAGAALSASASSSSSSSTVICTDVRRAACAMQREVIKVRHALTDIIQRVQRECSMVKMDDWEDADRIVMQTRTREILHQSFKFGFDYHKELVRLFEAKLFACGEDACEFNLSLGIIQFAKMWMSFVTTSCERGRGVRPRWAAQGLEFLIAACDPANTKHLTERDFDDLKAKMDACISHVVGMVSEPEKLRKRASPRARKISPISRSGTPNGSPRIIGDEQRQYFQQLSVREETGSLSGSSAPNSPLPARKQTSCVDGTSSGSSSPSTGSGGTTDGDRLKVPRVSQHVKALRQIRIRDSVNQLDLQLEQNLRGRNLIGQVKTLNATDKVQIRARHVHFRWHRGIKIGQGRFGKVYTAVNNSTGELMAMKEITIQPNETRAIKNVAVELKIFEGIAHKYLVKYYGIEVHREELLIFMELCAEGTLESLVELSGQLHEGLTRRFTAQLLTAVEELHKHGVVHRDIKTANIFLTNGGNCLKLGDFGSATKIQAHTTVPGELKGLVGTQAYMAPEVVTRTNTDGHGRAADIWSAGCVTIEMASGKRPWAQFDSNFQIMFKLGMGEKPDVPGDLSAEGKEFLDHCLEHDPKLRWTASELLRHNFCKVDMDSGRPVVSEARRTARKMSAQRR